jgi:hypothetical protein
MRTKQVLVIIFAMALVVLLRLSPKAVDMGNPVILNQPPPEDTNCYPASTNVLCAPEPGPVFLSTGVTNQCDPDAMIVAWATYTNVPGTVTTTITYSNPACPALVSTQEVSSIIVTNWWEATGAAVPSSGPGLGASFALTNCGGGTVYFYLTYSNAPPCSNATTIPTSIDYAIEADCSRHNPGSEIRVPGSYCCTTNSDWWLWTNSLCGDSFNIVCLAGAIAVTTPGGPCGVCPYESSRWDAWYTFCLCRAKIMTTRFDVVDTGTNSPTRGQGTSWVWTCGSSCTSSNFVVGSP